MEGEWSHAKQHVNRDGGTRDYMIQERLDEYIFHRTYLRDQPFNVFIMLRLLAIYGMKAFQYVEDEKNNVNEQSDSERIYYRCEEIEDDDDNKEDNNNNEEQEEEDENDFAGYRVDDNGNLIRYNEYGDIIDVHYADPEQRDLDLDDQLSQLEPQADVDMGNECVFDVEQEDPQLFEQIMQHFDCQ